MDISMMSKKINGMVIMQKCEEQKQVNTMVATGFHLL